MQSSGNRENISNMGNSDSKSNQPLVNSENGTFTRGMKRRSSEARDSNVELTDSDHSAIPPKKLKHASGSAVPSSSEDSADMSGERAEMLHHPNLPEDMTDSLDIIHKRTKPLPADSPSSGSLSLSNRLIDTSVPVSERSETTDIEKQDTAVNQHLHSGMQDKDTSSLTSATSISPTHIDETENSTSCLTAVKCQLDTAGKSNNECQLDTAGKSNNECQLDTTGKSNNECQLVRSLKGEDSSALAVDDTNPESFSHSSCISDVSHENGSHNSSFQQEVDKGQEGKNSTNSGYDINTVNVGFNCEDSFHGENIETAENPSSVGSNASHSRRESMESIDSQKGTSEGDSCHPSSRPTPGRPRGRKIGRRKSATGKKVSARRRSSSTEQSQQDEGDTEHLKLKKVPNRPGITFEIGAYVEAKDYWEKWYPSKIIDVDTDEAEVLIHFVKWSHRFDEWMPMDSPRLRPITHPATRNDIKGKLKTFKVGEKVNARWTDCKMYPGKIVEINADGTYTVMFYDGYRRRVQAINIQRGKAGDNTQGSMSSPGESQPKVTEKKPKLVNSPSLEVADSQDKAETGVSERRGIFTWAAGIKRRSSTGGSTAGKRTGTRSSSISGASDKQDSADGMANSDETSASLSKPQKPTEEETTTEEAKPIEESEVKDQKQVESVLPSLPASPVTEVQPPVHLTGRRVAPKEFIIEEDHNHHKCSVDGCGKAFRKESLLQSHLKHYHNLPRIPTAQPAKASTSSSTQSSKPVKPPTSSSTQSSKPIKPPTGSSTQSSKPVKPPTSSSTPTPTPKPLKTSTSSPAQPSKPSKASTSSSTQSSKPSKASTSSSTQSSKPSTSVVATTPNDTKKASGSKSQKPDSDASSPVAEPDKPSKPDIKRGSKSEVHETKTRSVSSKLESPSKADAKVNKSSHSRAPSLPASKPDKLDKTAKVPSKPDSRAPNRVEKQTKAASTAKPEAAAPAKVEKQQTAKQSSKGEKSPPTNNDKSETKPVKVATTKPFDVSQPHKTEKNEPKRTKPSKGDGAGITKTEKAESKPPRQPRADPQPSPQDSKKHTNKEHQQVNKGEKKDDSHKEVETVEPKAKESGSGSSSTSSKRSRSDRRSGTDVTSLSHKPEPISDVTPPKEPSHQLRSSKKRRLTSAPAVLEGTSPASENSPGAQPAIDPAASVKGKDSQAEGTPFTSTVEIQDATQTGVAADDVATEQPQLPTTTPEVAQEEEQDDAQSGEIVHCICDCDEENGLMMQCEVCLTWQHGSCFNIDEEEDVPETYVCYACTDPKGVREGSRYKHDPTWFKTGEMASFSFVQGTLCPAARPKAMLVTHDLVASVLDIDRVLHSLRLKLNVAGEENHPDLKLFSKPWKEGSSQNYKNVTDAPIKSEDDTKETETIVQSCPPAENTSQASLLASRSSTAFDHSYFLQQRDITEFAPPFVAEGDLVIAPVNSDDPIGSMCVEQTIDGHPLIPAVAEVEIQEDTTDPSPECQKPNLSAVKVEPNLSPVTADISVDPQPAESDESGMVGGSKEEQIVDLQQCKRNLIDHILSLEEEMERRLDSIEEQINVLEGEEDFLPHHGNLSVDEDDTPRLLMQVKSLMQDLQTVSRFSVHK